MFDSVLCCHPFFTNSFMKTFKIFFSAWCRFEDLEEKNGLSQIGVGSHYLIVKNFWKTIYSLKNKNKIMAHEERS